MLPDIAGCCGANRCRRRKQRYDDALGRIASDLNPSVEEIGGNSQQRCDKANQASIIPQEPNLLLSVRWRRNDAFLPGHRNGQPLSGCKTSRGNRGVLIARSVDDARIAAIFALVTGVGMVLDDFCCGRQPHNGRCLVDWKCPAIARHIPVEFIIVLEEAELPRGSIFYCVGVKPAAHPNIATANADALAV